MLPATVKLREVAPRDGFQSLAAFIPTAHKLRLIEGMVAAGIADIEATSFVSPEAIPQLRDAREVVAAMPRQNVTCAALVPNLVGAQHALQAGVDEIVVVISATDAHNRANVRRRVAESIEDLDPIFSAALEKQVAVNGAVAVAFGCPYTGDVSEKAVGDLVEAYVVRGAARVILADTTGMALPDRVAGMAGRLKDRYPALDLAFHFHNNRGTAMTNLYAALMAGARTFDTALGGIGGCPYVPQAAGNLPTEDVVYLLEEMGFATGIDLSAAIATALEMEKLLGVTLPGQVMKSGPRRPQPADEPCPGD